MFARPTLDPVAKYVLEDEEVLKSFVETFTGFSDIQILDKLDSNLNPLGRRFANLQEALAQGKKSLQKMIKIDPDGQKGIFEVRESLSIGEEEEPRSVKENNLTKLVYEIARHHGDLTKLFPDAKRSQVDVLCRYSQPDGIGRKEEIALIEIQVAQQDYWDQRGLAYAALIYGNQLRRGDEWSQLKNVIAINILGGGSKNVQYWKTGKYARHYKFQDQLDPRNIMPYLQVIQYSLGDTDLSSEEFQDESKKNLRDWLDFYRNCHQKGEVPEGISPELAKAYKQQLKLLENFKTHESIVREAGKEEGREEGRIEEKRETVKRMIQRGRSNEIIMQATELTEEEIERIRGEMAFSPTAS